MLRACSLFATAVEKLRKEQPYHAHDTEHRSKKGRQQRPQKHVVKVADHGPVRGLGVIKDTDRCPTLIDRGLRAYVGNMGVLFSVRRREAHDSRMGGRALQRRAVITRCLHFGRSGDLALG